MDKDIGDSRGGAMTINTSCKCKIALTAVVAELRECGRRSGAIVEGLAVSENVILTCGKINL